MIHTRRSKLASPSCPHWYVVLPVNPRGGRSHITLAGGDKKEDLKLTLTPTGALLGRVLDSAGVVIR